MVVLEGKLLGFGDLPRWPKAPTFGATLLKSAVISLFIASVIGCGHTPGRSDGAPGRKLNPNEIEDAKPKREPITRAGNKSPYTVLGQTYVLLPSAKGYRATGMASWYGTKFHGESTANGDRYDLYGMTAAHKTLPIPSYVLVTNLENNRQAIVRVNDRGPFVSNRIIDLSYAAATKLGYADKGTAFVEVAAIDVDNWPPRQVPDPAPPVTPPLLPVKEMPAQSPPSSRPDAAPLNSSVSGADAAAAQTAPAVSNQAPTPAGNYFVQAGAFSQRASAEKLGARLRARLPYAVGVQATTAPVLYRVRIGPFVDRVRADQVRSEVLDQHMVDSARVIEASIEDGAR